MAGVSVASQNPDAAKTAESFYMNTTIRQEVYTENEEILNENNSILREIEQRMSRTVKGSEIYKVNHTDGSVEVSEDTLHVLTQAVLAAQETGGAFSPALGDIMDAWNFRADTPRVPPEEQICQLLAKANYEDIKINQDKVDAGGTSIDLGGAVKGYALGQIAQNLAEHEVESALINAGGAIYAHGLRPNGEKWKIGIRDPKGIAEQYMGTLLIENAFLSTSGTYERGFTADGAYYHHLIDPKTGWPAENGLLSVTVVSEDGLLSDIYSTALFVMGPDAGLAYANENGIDAVFLTAGGGVRTTNGFAEKYTFEIRSGTTYHEE
ncbi:MAG: FAD:protein FMN transferase [Christensenellaceae bacterium]